MYLYRLGETTPLLEIKDVAELHGRRRDVTRIRRDLRAAGGGLRVVLRAGTATETLRADYRAAHPTQETRLEELEELVAALLFGGEGE